MQFQLFFLLIMALLLVIFTFQNPNPVQMRFMGWQHSQIPVVVVVLLSVLIGAITSLVLGFKQQIELKKEIRQLKSELEDLETPSVKSDKEEKL